MKITDDMLTDSRILKLVRRVLIDGNDKDKLSSASFLKFARAIEREVAGRRTTPDREAIRDAAFEQCAQLVDRMAKQKHDRGADDALVRSIAARIRALKTAPTSDKGGA